MRKSPSKTPELLLMILLISIMSACSKPVKTTEYFKMQPEEIQAEATRCLKNKSSNNDQTCTNVEVMESMRCIHQRRLNGNLDFGDINCDNPNQMLVLASKGF